MSARAVVLFSGGADCTLAAAKAARTGRFQEIVLLTYKVPVSCLDENAGRNVPSLQAAFPDVQFTHVMLPVGAVIDKVLRKKKVRFGPAARPHRSVVVPALPDGHARPDDRLLPRPRRGSRIRRGQRDDGVVGRPDPQGAGADRRALSRLRDHDRAPGGRLRRRRPVRPGSLPRRRGPSGRDSLEHGAGVERPRRARRQGPQDRLRRELSRTAGVPRRGHVARALAGVLPALRAVRGVQPEGAGLAPGQDRGVPGDAHRVPQRPREVRARPLESESDLRSAA